MARVCPHCGARRVMGVRYRMHRVVLVCPHCDDRFYPDQPYI